MPSLYRHDLRIAPFDWGILGTKKSQPNRVQSMHSRLARRDSLHANLTVAEFAKIQMKR